MHFFEASQDGANRSFIVYQSTNPTASNRFLVVGTSAETRAPGNTLLTTSLLVEAREGGRGPSRSASPASDRDEKGNRRYLD